MQAASSTRAPVRTRLRETLFLVGDGCFLALVGALGTFVMCCVHMIPWSFVACMVAGMVLAMVIQMVLAFCVAPLLGSIESMVPSMVLAMLAPMSICTLHLLGFEPDGFRSAALGALLGVVMLGFLVSYAVRCRRALRRTCSPG